MRTRTRLLAVLLPATLVALTVAPAARAGGSPPEAPSAKADGNAAKAVAAYNEGVAKVRKADAMGTVASKVYAFDYSARPDGKALREYEQAIADFARAVSLKPDHKESHNYLGYCYRRLGKLEHSLASYDKAIALDPGFALAREYRGETYLALGRVAEAEAELVELRKVDAEQAAVLEQSLGLYRDREKQAASGR
ncbi:MAG: tetratricopeptide repeat protein [bacterium]|nr:tetratricopeptide repeat protein [bacterium]